MKKLKPFLIPVIFALLTGVILGYLFFGGGTHENHPQKADDSVEQIYTCSMHPQIRQNEPGKCPLCGMDLIPLKTGKSSGEHDPFIYSMTKEAAAMANVQTSKVGGRSSENEIFLSAKIFVNEKKLETVTSNFAGRIDKLFVNYTGQNIKIGDKLVSIYSPDLLMAQKELREAAKNKENFPALYNAAKEKLRLWKLNENQIAEIESKGEIIEEFEIESDVSGIVLNRKVSQGSYVNKGSVLFEIADLTTLWLIMDAYESDLQWIKKGDKVVFTVQSSPGKEFVSNIEFIDPVIDPGTRTLKIRAEISNSSGLLKPEMLATARILSKKDSFKNSIIIPKSSVLWTGKRSIVYVKAGDVETPSFEMREIKLGNQVGNSYIVKEGLKKDEEIITNGVFAVDGAAQLSGNYSMMNRPPENRIPVEFRMQLTKLVEHYFIMKDHFVESDSVKSAKSAKNMIPVLKAVDMKLVEGDDRNKWMELLKNISNGLNSIVKSNDLESQRVGFSAVSDNIIEASDFFRSTISEVFVQFCPMAFDDKGAYWLSKEKEIMNPYFGDEMLNCGEIKKTIRSSGIGFH